MNRRRRTHRPRWVGVLLAAAVVALAGSSAALAQSVPVTVEIEGPEQPAEPTETPMDEPTEQTSEPPVDDPPDSTYPALPPGEEPPPAAADPPPPDEPLARTGADTFRTVRDAAALIAAGLLLLIATRKPERTRG